jgi:hypothetical protein
VDGQDSRTYFVFEEDEFFSSIEIGKGSN